jgi:hypothetical protein
MQVFVCGVGAGAGRGGAEGKGEDGAAVPRVMLMEQVKASVRASETMPSWVHALAMTSSAETI